MVQLYVVSCADRIEALTPFLFNWQSAPILLQLEKDTQNNLQEQQILMQNISTEFDEQA